MAKHIAINGLIPIFITTQVCSNLYCWWTWTISSNLPISAIAASWNFNFLTNNGRKKYCPVSPITPEISMSRVKSSNWKFSVNLIYRKYTFHWLVVNISNWNAIISMMRRNRPLFGLCLSTADHPSIMEFAPSEPLVLHQAMHELSSFFAVSSFVGVPPLQLSLCSDASSFS